MTSNIFEFIEIVSNQINMYKNGLVTVLTRGDQEGPDNPVEKKYMHMKWMVDANENNGWPPIEKKPERKKKTPVVSLFSSPKPQTQKSNLRKELYDQNQHSQCNTELGGGERYIHDNKHRNIKHISFDRPAVTAFNLAILKA
jgi:hypothetical protein